ncbi:hypothetical protein [Escherichia coli]|uniref:hypothetical protein n=1 Tax=Escherichia coli TaxID=562 RepID=UPI0039E17098
MFLIFPEKVGEADTRNWFNDGSVLNIVKREKTWLPENLNEYIVRLKYSLLFHQATPDKQSSFSENLCDYLPASIFL